MIWVLIIAFILIILFVAIYYLTYKVLFHPTHDEDWKPECQYEEWFIPTDKSYRGILYKHKNNIPWYIPCITVWYFKHFARRPTVLFFHGNYGNISYREYVWRICQQFELNLMLVDYRGYGKSNGDPTPGGICQDGLIAYDYLLDRVEDPNKIVIWGESLGGSVATYVAANRRCRCLLLLCTFASIEDVIFRNEYIPWWIKSSGLIIKHLIDNVPSKERIMKVKDPVIVMHSIDDELINYENANILFNNVQHNFKDLITIGGGHSTPKFTQDDLIRLFHYVNNYEHSPTWNKYDDIHLTPIIEMIENASNEYHKHNG